jgi:outer membrane receptor protein involved in Fe transport
MGTRTRAASAARSRIPKSTIGLAVAAALAGAAAPGAPAVAATPEASAGTLQEIVVTARKREENVQDVPISIEVLTQKDLQNLGIARLEDYVFKVPSMSHNTIGPGTQVLFCRGVSDGSNGNYATTSATGFFLDDSSLSWFGVQPDLHIYDFQRIEVLNGPQGTLFGAGSMACAIRYIINKPDVNAFSAGADFDGGQIQHGQGDYTYEGFLNVPLIDGRLGLRLSAFSASQGGFIDNLLTTRTWVNGAVSDNAPWARNNFNRQHQEGGRVALKGVLNEHWSATLSYDYQRQTAFGAWDEDLINYGPRSVSRFGPEFLGYQARIGDLRVDGDVGIADLVFASTYWSLPTRRWDEYSQYMENFAPSYTPFFTNGAPGCTGTTCNAPPAGANEGFACLSDPAYGGTPFTGCNSPVQFYEYHTNPERWSDELRLESKSGGRFHWLAGLYWEKTRDKNSGSTYFMPGLQYNGAAFLSANGGSNVPSLPSGVWFAYTERSDYLQTTEFTDLSFDLTAKLNVEAGVVHFHSDARYFFPYSAFAYQPLVPGLQPSSSNKWNSKAGVSYKLTDKVMLYANFGQGFRDGGSNAGNPASCYTNGVPQEYVPDTLNNYEIGWKSTSLGGRLLWNGATYLMNWKDLQTSIYDANICPPSSFVANVGQARVYGVESNVDYKLNSNWSLQAAASYTDSHLISSHYTAFQPNVGERLPFVPYFSYSANVRYEQPLGVRFKGYAQLDLAHKGDMWNDLHVAGTNGLPRVLQPDYTLLNVRFGLNAPGSQWLAELYVTNLTNKTAILYTNPGNFDVRHTINEPRVYGVRLNYRFGKAAGGGE